MFDSIWQDIRKAFSQGNMVTRLIIMNLAVFVVVNLIWVIARISSGWQDVTWYQEFLRFFMISSDGWHNLTHPWVILTNIFLHQSFWHILWNMLFLYWFGRILGDLLGDHRILPLYLLGGIFGGIAYFATANIFQYGGTQAHYALGASGAVMAIVAASGYLAPDYMIRLLLIGTVRLKYVVLVLLFIDILAIGANDNTGGHFAHLGGALLGGVFIAQLQRGKDWSIPVNAWLDKIGGFFGNLTRRSAGGWSARNSGQNTQGGQPPRPKSADRQEKLDRILEKIKQNGYDSLTDEEKDFLYQASKD